MFRTSLVVLGFVIGVSAAANAVPQNCFCRDATGSTTRMCALHAADCEKQCNEKMNPARLPGYVSYTFSGKRINHCHSDVSCKLIDATKNGAVLWENKNGVGPWCLEMESEGLVSPIRTMTSSLHVAGGWCVRVCTGEDLKGRCATYTGGYKTNLDPPEIGDDRILSALVCQRRVGFPDRYPCDVSYPNLSCATK